MVTNMASPSTSEVERRLAVQQMIDDLGPSRREWVTTRDEDRRFQSFADVTSAQLEGNRAINQAGRGNAQQAGDRAACDAWSNLQDTLQDLQEVEDLENIKDGQSHRARLTHDVKEQGGQRYSRLEIEGMGSGSVGRRRGGTGGVVPHPDRIVSMGRPLDPAIDPEREYYLTRKGNRGRNTPSRGGNTNSSRVTKPPVSNIPEFLRPVGAARQPGRRIPPAPIHQLASPEDFMASVARRTAAGSASQNVTRTNPAPETTQGNQDETRNLAASKAGPSTRQSATQQFDRVGSSQPSIPGAAGRTGRPSNLGVSFEDLMAADDQHNLVETQTKWSSGTDGLPSPVSEHVELFNDEPSDKTQDIMDKGKGRATPLRISFEPPTLFSYDDVGDDDQGAPPNRNQGGNAIVSVASNAPEPQPDLMDTSNDILNTAALEPNPQRRMNINGFWYILEDEVQQPDKGPIPRSNGKEVSTVGGLGLGEYPSHQEKGPGPQYTASRRPPSYGRGTHTMPEYLIDEHKVDIMRVHNMSEERYKQLSTREKVLLAHSIRYPEEHKTETPIPRPEAVLAISRNAPASESKAGKDITKATLGHKSNHSGVSDISHGIENIRISSPTKPAFGAATSSKNPFANHTDDSVYRQTSRSSVLSGTRVAGPVPSVRSGNISTFEPRVDQDQPRSRPTTSIRSASGPKPDSQSQGRNAGETALTEQVVRNLSQGTGRYRNVPQWLRSDLLPDDQGRHQPQSTSTQAISESGTHEQRDVQSIARSGVKPTPPVVTPQPQTRSRGLGASKYAS